MLNICGQTVTCAPCPANQYCSSGTCQPITATYDCACDGISHSCVKNLQYCNYYYLYPGCSPSCVSVPAACSSALTCACLRANNAILATDTCTDGTGANGVGAVYVHP
jgi:hypothetical protein